MADRLAVVIPTIAGREAYLEQCIAAYRATAPKAKLYVEHDHPSCGHAWRAGAEKALKDRCGLIHLTADDLEPHDGWLAPAVETVKRGEIPAPLVFHPSGALESAGLVGFGMYSGEHHDGMPIDSTTVPFLTAQMWKRIGMLDIHYCSDLWVSHQGRKHGWETVIRTGMRFTHHTAPQGRDYSRVGADTQAYLAAIA